MNAKFILPLVVIAGTFWMSACQMGPSPEAKARNYSEERDQARRQAEFRKGLPPVEGEQPEH